MTVFVAKAIVPISAMQGNAVEIVEIHDVGDVFQIVIVDLPFGTGHFILLKAIPDLKQAFVGRPAIETGRDQGRIDQAITFVGGEGLFIEIYLYPEIIFTYPSGRGFTSTMLR